MELRHHQIIVAAGLAAALLYIGCGGGGTEPPSATPNLEPALTGSPSQGLTPAAVDSSVIDLASASPLTTVYAVDQGDVRSDQPGLAAGDFNDDGIGDMLVGARFADGPDSRKDSGAAYLVFGSPSPPSSVDLAAGQQDVTILGARPGDGLGFAAAAADLNGDGIDDITLGAPFGGPLDQPASDPGRVYIIFGRPDLPATVDLAAEPSDVVLTGATSGAFFGDSIAAGDVNGDGTADLIVGATFDSYQPEDGPPVRGGAVLVFFGRDGWPDTLTSGEADVAVYGAEDFDELGDFVASGDINGDGFDDIIATAEAADGPDNARPTAAEVHVVFGDADIQGAFEIARGQQHLSVYGAFQQDTLGFSLAAGDVDGDGIDDLVMGARGANGPDNTITRAGQVYVLSGSGDLPRSVDLADLPDFVGAFHGASPSTLMGTSEAVADLDGDGRSELIMGARSATALSRPDAGVVYVSEAPAGGDLVSVEGEALRVAVYGAADDENLGSNVAVADFNGDGQLELIVVAQGGDGPDDSRPGVGRIYAISLAP